MLKALLQKAAFVLAIAGLVFSNPNGMAQAADDAISVMSKSREMRKGLTNSVSDVTMTIQSGGTTITREMRQYVLEVQGDGNRTINVFSRPADVSGVSVLTHSALDGNDRQWLYLPSMGRVRRIASSNRSGSFVGSEFAFEDLASFEVEKYVYDSVTNVTQGGRSLIVVAYRPKYSGSGYSRIEASLDSSNYQPVEIRYFNRRSEHFKTLQLSDYRSYGSGRMWRPHRLVMTNHNNGNVSQIDFAPFRRNGTSAASFNPNQFQMVQ